MSQTQPKLDLRPGWMKEIAELITHLTGVQLGEQQRAMLESRLQKRIRDLGLQQPSDYLDYVRSHVKTEGNHLISLLTTHHTFFFREFAHFEYLGKEVLPKVIANLTAQGRKTIRVWSAACSQGQEVYSLAMYLFNYVKQNSPGFQFEIFGTDVDPESVRKAKNGVYRWADIKEIPLVYLWSHWTRGTGDIQDYVKAKPSLKQYCKFDVVNLMQIPEPRPNQSYDVVFCRNVFIYFTHEQVKAVTLQLLKHLSPEGFLFVGATESLVPFKLPVKSVAPSIYQKPGESAAPKKQSLKVVAGGIPTPKASPAKAVVPSTPTPAKKIRVLCVDDSATILALLRKILDEEFEVVGVAKNGIEAKEMTTKLEYDVMTLDIHMPIQGGVDYLRANMGAKHPPVVMISSVPREDSSLAFECLNLGANDYVEKPSMQDLNTRAEEIRTKIRCAVAMGRSHGRPTEVDRAFKTTIRIENPSESVRIIVAGVAERGKIATILSELSVSEPPTFVLMQGASGILPAITEQLGKDTKKSCRLVDELSALPPINSIVVGDFNKVFAGLKTVAGNKPASIILLGDANKEVASRLLTWQKHHLILEDLGVELSKKHQELARKADYFIPHTSMSYHSTEYLAKVGKNGK